MPFQQTYIYIYFISTLNYKSLLLKYEKKKNKIVLNFRSEKVRPADAQETASKKVKVSLQEIHDLQYQVLKGKLLQQEKENKKLDLQIQLLQKLVNSPGQQLTLSQTLASMFD